MASISQPDAVSPKRTGPKGLPERGPRWSCSPGPSSKRASGDRLSAPMGASERRLVAVTFPVQAGDRGAFERVLGGSADLAFVSDLDPAGRLDALGRAEALLSW